MRIKGGDKLRVNKKVWPKVGDRISVINEAQMEPKWHGKEGKVIDIKPLAIFPINVLFAEGGFEMFSPGELEVKEPTE